jgi:hypothetical protein
MTREMQLGKVITKKDRQMRLPLENTMRKAGIAGSLLGNSTEWIF